MNPRKVYWAISAVLFFFAFRAFNLIQISYYSYLEKLRFLLVFDSTQAFYLVAIGILLLIVSFSISDQTNKEQFLKKILLIPLIAGLFKIIMLLCILPIVNVFYYSRPPYSEPLTMHTLIQYLPNLGHLNYIFLFDWSGMAMIISLIGLIVTCKINKNLTLRHRT